MMIGEQFEDASDEVRGAVVNIRPKGDKLALWTGHYDRREETTRIGSAQTRITKLSTATTYMHAYIHTYVRTYVRTYLRLSV